MKPNIAEVLGAGCGRINTLDGRSGALRPGPKCNPPKTEGLPLSPTRFPGLEVRLLAGLLRLGVTKSYFTLFKQREKLIKQIFASEIH